MQVHFLAFGLYKELAPHEQIHEMMCYVYVKNITTEERFIDCI